MFKTTLWILGVVGFGAATTALLLNARRDACCPVFIPDQASLPLMYKLPDFSLTERSGRPVTLESLAGKVWINAFIFTYCPGPCPLITMSMEHLQEALPEADDLRLVTISVDPWRDTPERLSEYADRHGADPDRWLFLTGEAEAIYSLSVDGFKLAAGKPDDADIDPGHPIVHSTRLTLVDRQGRIRGYYDALDEAAVERLKADALRVLEEDRGTKGERD
jgi:protein SCO1